MDKPSYFAIIPAKIRYDDKLTNSQKIMFGEITALSNKHGYCNASNTYFSKLYGVDPSTVSKWIKGLEKQGYIEVEYTREGKQIKGRKLRPLMDHRGIESDQGGIELNQYPNNENHGQNGLNVKKGIEPIQEGVLNKPQGGIEYIPKSNNTSNNNTSKSAREDLHPLQKFVRDELPEVSKLDKQLTFDNCETLMDDFNKSMIRDVLLSMENYNGLTSKYKSVYLTTRNWCKKRLENNPELKQKSSSLMEGEIDL